MRRAPRDVSIHVFRTTADGVQFLMLRRIASRGGFWQGVTGAPLAGETDAEAAIREVREETGYDVRSSVIPLNLSYRYALRPELAERWRALYGPGVDEISVVAFGAEVPAAIDPVLDPAEHDSFAWCTYRQADALLDWPIERDALPGRRQALRALADTIAHRPRRDRTT
jgi:8-oxo-dGTP pyrophosphatase MutT (NUDIX family)